MSASDDPLHFSTGASSNIGSLRFASVVSSLGATFAGPGASDLESYHTQDEREEEGEGISMESLRTRAWTGSDASEAGPSSRRDARSTPSSGATLVSDDAKEASDDPVRIDNIDAVAY